MKNDSTTVYHSDCFSLSLCGAIEHFIRTWRVPRTWKTKLIIKISINSKRHDYLLITFVHAEYNNEKDLYIKLGNHIEVGREKQQKKNRYIHDG